MIVIPMKDGKCRPSISMPDDKWIMIQIRRYITGDKKDALNIIFGKKMLRKDRDVLEGADHIEIEFSSGKMVRSKV